MHRQYLLLVAFVLSGVLGAQESLDERLKIQDFEKEEYRRTPRMEEEDRLRGRDFKFSPGLEIIADVDDVEVLLFEEEAGYTPWERDITTPGAYRVELKRSGYAPLTFWITLRGDRRVVVHVTMEKGLAKLHLKNLPPQARVYVDHQSVELSSPLALPVGRRNIRVEAFGWTSEEVVLLFQEGEEKEWVYPGHTAEFQAELSRVRLHEASPSSPRLFTIPWRATGKGQGQLHIYTDGRIRESLPIQLEESKGRIQWRDDAQEAPRVYRFVLDVTGQDGSHQQSDTEVKRDGRFFSVPRHIVGGIPGYYALPGATLLPAKSWQISSGVMLQRAYGKSSFTPSIPTHLSMRVSPAQGWEVDTAFRVVIRDPFDETGIGFDLGVSWRMTPTGPFAVNAALGFNYDSLLMNYSQMVDVVSRPILPGILLTIPSEWRFGPLIIGFSPGMQLTFLDDDFEQFTLPAHVTLSTAIGIHVEFTRITAGISAAYRSSGLGGSELPASLHTGGSLSLRLPGEQAYLALEGGAELMSPHPRWQVGMDIGTVF